MFLNKIDNRIYELVCRLYVFGFLNFYGIGKIMGGQFYRRGRLPEDVAAITLENASAFNIAWTFMGYSYGYILFVGILQIIGAWFLLLNKTKIIGVFILLPIMVNIIVFDIIFLESKGALANAMLYFLLLNLILYFNKEKIQKAFAILTNKIKINNNQISSLTSKTKRVLVIAGIMTLLFVVDQLLVNLFRLWH
ncbi:hypothetical protein WIW50_15600 [Flavobacteriaceae bacterium 3-367]|uniref:hypothetical protein n=1 Tax=Eudoraea algarum TaxID=3417568 RepID=UPI00328D5087